MFHHHREVMHHHPLFLAPPKGPCFLEIALKPPKRSGSLSVGDAAPQEWPQTCHWFPTKAIEMPCAPSTTQRVRTAGLWVLLKEFTHCHDAATHWWGEWAEKQVVLRVAPLVAHHWQRNPGARTEKQNPRASKCFYWLALWKSKEMVMTLLWIANCRQCSCYIKKKKSNLILRNYF